MIDRGAALRRFQALGDGQRLAIVELLRERPRSVRELADRLPVSRPAVSRHLRLLKDAGFVDDVPAGTRRIYALRDDGLDALAGDLDVLWGEALRRFALVAGNATRFRRDG